MLDSDCLAVLVDRKNISVKTLAKTTWRNVMLFMLATMLVLLSIGSTDVLADELVITENDQVSDLLNHGQIYPAQSDVFPADVAQLAEWKDKNTPILSPSQGIPPGKYWFYITLKNTSQMTDFVINPHNSSFDISAMGLYQGEKFYPQIEGFNQQHGYLRDYGRQVKLASNESYLLLVLFDSKFSFDRPKLTLQKQVDYGRSAALQNALILFCIGILLVIILYALN